MPPAEQTVERRALESAVANSLYLRGLGLVPLGLMFVFGALAMWEVGPLRHLGVAYLAIVLPAALLLWINRYYEEHYGRVTPSPSHRVRTMVHIAVTLAAAVGAWLLIWSLDLPLNAFAAAWSVTMLMATAFTVGLRKHRVIIWGSLLVAGLLPVWDGADASTSAWLLGGVAFIATGILDHRLLARTSGPRADRSLETRDAGA
jgi:hypothetical protein